MAKRKITIRSLIYILNEEDKTATVYNVEEKDFITNIIIPSFIEFEDESYVVTCIGKWAFHNCSELSSVSIPNSVISIEEGAFAECTRLISITIPNSVKSIKAWAFYQAGFNSITIPNSVKRVSKWAFSSKCKVIRNEDINN